MQLSTFVIALFASASAVFAQDLTGLPDCAVGLPLILFPIHLSPPALTHLN
jgi:hypothetical protein